MRKVLTFILNTLTSANPAITSILGIASVLLAVNGYINSLWTDLFARIDSVSAGTFGDVDFSPMTSINTVVPLDAFCTYLGAYLTLLGVCTSIRIIKSWLPTVSG